MKRLIDPFFIAYCSSWLAIHLLRLSHLPLPLLNDYLTDFTTVPVMAHLALAFMRCFIVRDNKYEFPLFYLLFIALYISIIFELVMPKLSRAYTCDIGDVFAYFAGAFFYHFVHVGWYGRRSYFTGVRVGAV